MTEKDVTGAILVSVQMTWSDAITIGVALQRIPNPDRQVTALIAKMRSVVATVQAQERTTVPPRSLRDSQP